MLYQPYNTTVTRLSTSHHYQPHNCHPSNYPTPYQPYNCHSSTCLISWPTLQLSPFCLPHPLSTPQLSPLYLPYPYQPHNCNSITYLTTLTLFLSTALPTTTTTPFSPFYLPHAHTFTYPTPYRWLPHPFTLACSTPYPPPRRNAGDVCLTLSGTLQLSFNCTFLSPPLLCCLVLLLFLCCYFSANSPFSWLFSINFFDFFFSRIFLWLLFSS